MKCPTCGAGELVRDTREMPYTYKAKSTLIPAVTGDWCTACHEVVLGVEAGQNASVAMLDFNRQVNAGKV